MQKNARKYLRVIALATGSLLWMTENTLLTNSSTFRIFSRCFSLSCVTFSTQSRRKLFLIWQEFNYRFITFHSVQILKYISIPDTFHNRDRTEAQQSIVLDKYYYSKIFDQCNWLIRCKYSREPCNNSIYTASFDNRYEFAVFNAHHYPSLKMSASFRKAELMRMGKGYFWKSLGKRTTASHCSPSLQDLKPSMVRE